MHGAPSGLLSCIKAKGWSVFLIRWVELHKSLDFCIFPSGSLSLFCSNLSIFLDAYCTVESCCVLPTINNNFTISEISYRKAGLKKATVNTDVHIVVIGTHFNQYHGHSSFLHSCLSFVDISYWNRTFGQDIYRKAICKYFLLLMFLFFLISYIFWIDSYQSILDYLIGYIMLIHFLYFYIDHVNT